jgi:hypothetical protein
LKFIDDKFNLNNVSLLGDDDQNGNKKITFYNIDGEEFSRKQITDAHNKNQNLSIFDIGPRNKNTRNFNNESLRNALDKNKAAHGIKKDESTE